MAKEGNVSYDIIASSKKISTPKKKLVHNNKDQSSVDGDNDKENKLRKEPDELQCYVCGERNSMKSKIMDHIRDTHFQDVKNSMFGRPREFQCHECRLVHGQSSYWTANSSFLFLASDHTEADPNYTLGVDFWTMIFYNLKNSG